MLTLKRVDRSPIKQTIPFRHNSGRMLIQKEVIKPSWSVNLNNILATYLNRILYLPAQLLEIESKSR